MDVVAPNNAELEIDEIKGACRSLKVMPFKV